MNRTLLALSALFLGSLAFAGCRQDFAPGPGLYAYAARDVTADSCHIDALLAKDGVHFTIASDDGKLVWVPGDGGQPLSCEPGQRVFTCERDIDRLAVAPPSDASGVSSLVSVRQTIEVVEELLDDGSGHAFSGTITGHVECASADGCQDLLDMFQGKLPCDYTLRFQADEASD